MREEQNFEEIRTHCSRMDHGGCGLIVRLKKGEIVGIRGNPEAPLSRGYICPKGIASIEKLQHPKRLRFPMRRIDKRGANRWKQISWEEALKIISDKFLEIKDRYGARSVCFCQGMPKGLEHFVLIRLANLFGSPNVVAVQDVCHAPREITGLHLCGFYPVVDFRHKSRLIVLWGSNPMATNEEGATGKLLLEQLREGTPLVTVDPRKTDMSKRSKIHLQLRPGSDTALALGIYRVIVEEKLYDEDFVKQWVKGFEAFSDHVKSYSLEEISSITWVPSEQIIETARLYATSKPAAIHWGNAIEQNRNNFDTVRSLIALMAICGNLDIPGGNIQPLDPPITPLGKFVRASKIPEKPKEMIHAHFGTIPKLMTVPPAFFRRAVLEGKPYEVRAVYMQCTNPLITWADSELTEKTLKSLDFLVVSDVFLTPTALYADIVLPAATQFEFNDIGHYGLGHGYILARPKVVDPPLECWPDMKILNELGKLITDPSEWYDNYEELLEEVLKPTGLTYREFAERGYLAGEDKFLKYRNDGFKTPSGKVELVMPQASKWGAKPLPDARDLPDTLDASFPLLLTSAKDKFYLHSSYRWISGLRKLSDRPYVKINPETASRYGIQDGDEVIVETRNGKRIIQTAELTDSVHPLVVVASYGWWFPELEAEREYGWKIANYNMLTSALEPGQTFGTCNMRGIACRIAPLKKHGV
ncbi:MAG: molybdopterin-dependent oxidoreductase [Syntrophobacterales bacterium]|nr:molybdopterin-dependent oxidoreductase [Syntrophobacterales bacterium]